MTITMIFLILALVCFLIGSANAPILPINWVSLGLAFVTIARLLGGLVRL